MKVMQSFCIPFMVFIAIALSPVWGQEKNLGVNKAVTARIRAFDREFFRGFDVYSAEVEMAPTALLFDIKDDYHLPTRFWGDPLSEEEIISALSWLDIQYNENKTIPFEPRALNVISLKGEVLGYCYTGLDSVLMDRKKDGSVTVFRPTAKSLDGGGDGVILPGVR